MKIGVVGATGLVGEILIKILEGDKKVKEIVPFATGEKKKFINFRNKKIKIRKIEEIEETDYTFFCVESEIAEKIYPLFSKKTKLIIDNSSAFRLKEDVPLVVPEVNPEDIEKNKGLISNPNCSTIQLVVPLKALEKYNPLYVMVATYQSVSGAGRDGVLALKYEIRGKKYLNSPFDKKIFNNLIPKIGEIKENHSVEEWKMILESKKIMKKDIKVYPTCVRIPIENCHSQSVFIKFENEINEKEIIESLSNFPSIKIVKDIISPQDVKEKDEIYISRIRVYEKEKIISFFSIFDNLRKGAATNAYQIAKIIWEGK